MIILSSICKENNFTHNKYHQNIVETKLILCYNKIENTEGKT
jgi:hypothetical protein